MYDTNLDDFQKSPPPSAPPSYGYSQPPAAGIPVAATNYTYGENSQAPHQFETNTPQYWSSGLFDCRSDVHNSCVTCLCPCITFGQIAEIVDKGSTSCAASGGLYALMFSLSGCACIYSSFYRSRMRQQYMLPASPRGDCLVHFCCECCALCQEYRELRNRGFDMSLGWQGNMEKQNNGVKMAPIVQEGMKR